MFSQTLLAKIYKRVDENGKTHYSDKPFDGEFTTIKIKDNITPEHRRVKNQFESEYEEAKQKREQQEKIRKLNRACSQAQQNLKILQMQVRVFSEKKNGKREYISDKKRKQKIGKLKLLI